MGKTRYLEISFLKIRTVIKFPLSVLVNKGTVHDITFINKHYNDLIIFSKKNNIKKYLLADKAYESKK